MAVDNSVYVFDADGVVVKPWGFANALITKHGITTDDTKAFFAGPFQSCLTGNADLLEMVKPYLQGWRWSGSAESFVEFWMVSDDRPDDRVIGYIQALREQGAKCYLASNQERVRAAYIRTQMGFDELFDQLFFSCDLGCVKPDRLFFSAVAAEIGVSPAEIRFWDDSTTNVAGAISAGWNAFQFEHLDSLDIR